MIFPVNKEDPMNGIFRYLLNNNLTSLIAAGQKNLHLLTAFDLIYKNPENKFATTGTSSEYIEFNITGLNVYLKGYGIMSYYNDDNIPRNWKITCTDNDEVEMTNEVSNNELCEGKNGYLVKCEITDKKAFFLQHPMKCNRIRYYGYKDSSNENFIVMSGFELFGAISLEKSFNMCTCRNRARNHNFIFFTLLCMMS